MGPREEAQGWQADDTPEPRRSLMRNVALPPHTTEETPDALEVARVLWMVLLRCRRSSTSSFILVHRLVCRNCFATAKEFWWHLRPSGATPSLARCDLMQTYVRRPLCWDCVSLRRCKLTAVPFEIRQLRALASLDLSFNNLSRLP